MVYIQLQTFYFNLFNNFMCFLFLLYYILYWQCAAFVNFVLHRFWSSVFFFFRYEFYCLFFFFFWIRTLFMNRIKQNHHFQWIELIWFLKNGLSLTGVCLEYLFKICYSYSVATAFWYFPFFQRRKSSAWTEHSSLVYFYFACLSCLCLLRFSFSFPFFSPLCLNFFCATVILIYYIWMEWIYRWIFFFPIWKAKISLWSVKLFLLIPVWPLFSSKILKKKNMVYVIFRPSLQPIVLALINFIANMLSTNEGKFSFPIWMENVIHSFGKIDLYLNTIPFMSFC